MGAASAGAEGIELGQQVPVIGTGQARRVQGRVALGGRPVTGGAKLLVVAAALYHIALHRRRRGRRLQRGDVGGRIVHGLLVSQGGRDRRHLPGAVAVALAAAYPRLEILQLGHDIHRGQLIQPRRLESRVALGRVAMTGNAAGVEFLAPGGIIRRQAGHRMQGNSGKQ